MWSRLQARIWPLARRRDCGELAAILRCLHTHSSGFFFVFCFFVFFCPRAKPPCTREHGHARTTLTSTHTNQKKTVISHTAVGSAKVLTTTALSWCAELSFQLHNVIARSHNSWSDWCGSGARCCYESQKKKKKGFCQRSRLSLGLEQVEPEVSEALLPPSARRKSMFMCYCKYSKSDITGGWHSIYYFDIHQVILLERWRTHMWRKKKKRKGKVRVLWIKLCHQASFSVSCDGGSLTAGKKLCRTPCLCVSRDESGRHNRDSWF